MGAWWLVDKVVEFQGKDENFLVTSPSYKTLQQSTLPPLLDALTGYGEYNKTDACFTCHSGAHIWIRTATDPDSVVGIPRTRAIWCDEAGKYSLYFWENIQGRASPMNAPILLTTSPYTLNWVYKDLIKPFKQGKRPDIKLIQARSDENPYFSQDAYNHAKATMDPRRFQMMYGGEWGRMAGLVYDCYEESRNLTEPFRLPNGTRFFAGVDWGYTDPFVIKIRAVTPDGQHYGASEFYKTGLTVADMVQVARAKQATFGIEAFYCDPSQPGHIEEFNRAGLNAIPADNDIRRGIDLHYELMKTGRLKYFMGMNGYTLDELETYHYPEPKDLGPDQSSSEQTPVSQNDHCLDADRYCTIMTYRSGLKTKPFAPSEDKGTQKAETQAARLKRLMSRNGRSGSHTETWGE